MSKKRYDDYREPFRRHAPGRPRKAGPIIGWDLETDNIPRKPDDPMSVGLRYLTVWGPEGKLASRPITEKALADVFDALFTPSRAKARFVAWNANRFDTLFLLRAIVRHAPFLVVKPMVAAQGGLRGARVTRRDNPKVWWDLCDGIAMTGIQKSLAEFTKTFAPHVAKLSGAVDFEREQFDAENPLHVAYAERDAESLFYAMTEVERIMVDLTGRQLRMTIGASGIRYFERNIPEGVEIRAVPDALWNAIFAWGMRGGYVYVARRHDGPAWQHDINQAYAAAMREEGLPAGCALATGGEVKGATGFYFCTIARRERSPIPFYCKDTTTNRPVECHGERMETFITSTEIAVLRRWGWTVDVGRGWVWTSTFSMRHMVDELEHIRTTDPEGPSGPVGTLCKAIGNNAYGKTTERLSREVVMLTAGDPPDDEHAWAPWKPELGAATEGFWVSFVETLDRRRYHRPHVGAFITAHVRMKLYDAIMQRPEAFLKADTDSIAWDRPVDHLDVDPRRYGAWKLEYDGVRMIVIGKKVYAIVGERDGLDVVTKAVCKGLNVRRLSLSQFEVWVRSGNPPRQSQVQAMGWSRGLSTERYRSLVRRGTDFRRTAPHLFQQEVSLGPS